jgi:hypothetical protein
VHCDVAQAWFWGRKLRYAYTGAVHPTHSESVWAGGQVGSDQSQFNGLFVNPIRLLRFCGILISLSQHRHTVRPTKCQSLSAQLNCSCLTFHHPQSVYLSHVESVSSLFDSCDSVSKLSRSLEALICRTHQDGYSLDVGTSFLAYLIQNSLTKHYST